MLQIKGHAFECGRISLSTFQSYEGSDTAHMPALLSISKNM
jgi:hypothetical protein